MQGFLVLQQVVCVCVCVCVSVCAWVGGFLYRVCTNRRKN